MTISRRRRRRSHTVARGVVLAFVSALLVTACGSSAPSNGIVPTLQLPPSGSVAPAPSPSVRPSATRLPSASPPATGGPASPAPSSAPPATSPGASGTASPSATTGALEWTTCDEPFECATLQVPLDYADPGGETITLALIRLPATDPDTRIGSLLTNPGGPGASGIEMVRNSAEGLLSKAIRSHFDIVGFDPRGVGQSTPIECFDGPQLDQMYQLDPTPETDAERQAVINATKAFDDACEAHSGRLLPHMTTADAARDMDRMREALGDEKLSYLGFSYGTFLGTVYAGLFPTHVRALVLDGAIDPALGSDEQSITQAAGFQQALEHFLADCASRRACPFYNGGKPGPALDALMTKIDAQPLPATLLKDPRPVGLWLAQIGLAEALYAEQLWPLLAQGLALAQRGDGSVLLLLADQYYKRNPDGTYQNLFAVFWAVSCTDYVNSPDVAHYEALIPRFEEVAPHFGEVTVYQGLNCAFWPVRATKDPGIITAEGAPPILVVGTTGDPATPYQWAVNLSKQLSSGVLLTREGEGHTAYGENACINRTVDAYLIALTVPPDGKICA